MSAHANGAKPRRNAQRMFTSRFEIFRAVPRVAPFPGLYQAELAPRTGLLVWSIDTELRGRRFQKQLPSIRNDLQTRLKYCAVVVAEAPPRPLPGRRPETHSERLAA